MQSIQMHRTMPTKESKYILIRFVAVFMVLCGFIYPILVTGIAGMLWPHEATGSIIKTPDGRAIGSEWIAQPFRGEQYLIGRPSSANHDPMAAAGSNLSATSRTLRDRLQATSDQIAQREQITKNQIPPDLITTSGSGLDPHISPEAAKIQAARIAKVRHIPISTVLSLIDEQTEPPTFGLLGQARVNVLRFNLALDRLYPYQHTEPKP